MAGVGQGSNPCSILNSYHAGTDYNLLEESGPPHLKNFVYSVNILGCEYRGNGTSKKRAKQAAAASALKSVYQINLSLSMEESAPPMIIGKPLEQPEASEFPLHNSYYDLGCMFLR